MPSALVSRVTNAVSEVGPRGQKRTAEVDDDVVIGVERSESGRCQFRAGIAGRQPRNNIEPLTEMGVPPPSLEAKAVSVPSR